MRRELFQPSEEGEARLLLLIAEFSRGDEILEGRMKLAKLDFFLRYPRFLQRAMKLRGASARSMAALENAETQAQDIESKMVRYRYGPWDPSYYALLGRLLGKNLVVPMPFSRGVGFRATDKGKQVANQLAETPVWSEVASRAKLLRRYLNLTGASLMRFVYENFPEVSEASWGESL